MRDAEAQAGADNGRRHDDEADQPEARAPNVKHETSGRRAHDDGDEGAHLQDAVRARQVAVGQNFGQDAVFRRAEERRLYGDEEQNPVSDFEASSQERDQSQRCSRDLKRLGHDENGPLAVDVGDLTGVARKEEKRQDEDGTHQREGPSRVRTTRGMHCNEGHDDLEEVVVERPQELCPQERLQSALRQRLAITPGHRCAPSSDLRIGAGRRNHDSGGVQGAS